MALTEQQRRIRAEAMELGYKTQPARAAHGRGFWWSRKRTLIIQHPAAGIRFCCGPNVVWAERRATGRRVYLSAVEFPRYHWDIEDFTVPPLDELNGWLLTALEESDLSQAQLAAHRALRGAARDLLRACLVITVDLEIAEWLGQHDPKALEQLQKAVALATSPDPDERATIIKLLFDG